MAEYDTRHKEGYEGLDPRVLRLNELYAMLLPSADQINEICELEYELGIISE